MFKIVELVRCLVIWINFCSDNMMLHGYQAMPLSGHPQIFLQQNLPLTGRTPIYKVAPSHGTQHSLLPAVRIENSFYWYLTSYDFSLVFWIMSIYISIYFNFLFSFSMRIVIVGVWYLVCYANHNWNVIYV